MELIDAAAGNLQRLASAIDIYKETIRTEADTRLKVINPILTDILGWSLADIFTEESAGTGFVDYKLTVNGYVTSDTGSQEGHEGTWPKNSHRWTGL